jgi:hypothetical protein
MRASLPPCAQIKTDLKETPAQNLAMTINSMAKLGFRPERAFLDIFCHTATMKIADFNPQVRSQPDAPP